MFLSLIICAQLTTSNNKIQQKQIIDNIIKGPNNRNNIFSNIDQIQKILSQENISSELEKLIFTLSNQIILIDINLFNTPTKVDLLEKTFKFIAPRYTPNEKILQLNLLIENITKIDIALLTQAELILITQVIYILTTKPQNSKKKQYLKSVFNHIHHYLVNCYDPNDDTEYYAKLQIEILKFIRIKYTDVDIYIQNIMRGIIDNICHRRFNPYLLSDHTLELAKNCIDLASSDLHKHITMTLMDTMSRITSLRDGIKTLNNEQAELFEYSLKTLLYKNILSHKAERIQEVTNNIIQNNIPILMDQLKDLDNNDPRKKKMFNAIGHLAEDSEDIKEKYPLFEGFADMVYEKFGEQKYHFQKKLKPKPIIQPKTELSTGPAIKTPPKDKIQKEETPPIIESSQQKPTGMKPPKKEKPVNKLMPIIPKINIKWNKLYWILLLIFPSSILLLIIYYKGRKIIIYIELKMNKRNIRTRKKEPNIINEFGIEDVEKYKNSIKLSDTVN